MKFFKGSLILIFCLCIAISALFLIKLFTGPNLISRKSLIKNTQKQLNFLEKELKENKLAQQMQQLYPEGEVFTNALYGLSYAELGILSNDNAVKEKALQEGLYILNNLNNPECKKNFYQTSTLPNGIFYLGWKNYFVSKLLFIKKDSILEREFKNNCKLIAAAIDSSESPFLETYPNQIYPADAFAAMASLRNYEKLYDTQYSNILKRWTKKVMEIANSEPEGLPHSINDQDKEKNKSIRGSSTALMLCLSTEINKELSDKLFEVFKKQFLSHRLGIPVVQEYPNLYQGAEDVDSGPVSWGIGSSATVVGITALNKQGAYKTAQVISDAAEATGMGYSWNNKKRYFLGKLPIADLFLTWSRISSVQNDRISYDNSQSGSKYGLVFILIFLNIIFLFFIKMIKRA